MPHITVEHTKDISTLIDLNKLNTDLHTSLSKQETVSLASIKTRSVAVDNVIIGNGETNNFMHINVMLLKGRKKDLKEKMAKDLFDVANNYLQNISCLLSVNIADLGTYQK